LGTEKGFYKAKSDNIELKTRGFDPDQGLGGGV
jgi:hypothetical protein